jgi:cell wall-associated NlpC family hydrolase
VREWSPELGQQIAERARHYLGVPYHHCGRSEHGLDCAGLVVRVCHDLGLMTWDEVDYSQQVNAAYMRECLARWCEPVTAEPLPGDLLWFDVEGNPQHLAVFYGGPDELMIHATNTKGRVVEHALRGPWRKTLAGVWRWRGEWQR